MFAVDLEFFISSGTETFTKPCYPSGIKELYVLITTIFPF